MMSNYVEAPETTLPVDPQPAERLTGGDSRFQEPNKNILLRPSTTHPPKKNSLPPKIPCLLLFVAQLLSLHSEQPSSRYVQLRSSRRPRANR